MPEIKIQALYSLLCSDYGQGRIVFLERSQWLNKEFPVTLAEQFFLQFSRIMEESRTCADTFGMLVDYVFDIFLVGWIDDVRYVGPKNASLV